MKMLVCKIKKWGNSFGLLIPKTELRKMDMSENQEVIVDITKKENPLKELFGFGKKSKITKEEFLKKRKMLESRV